MKKFLAFIKSKDITVYSMAKDLNKHTAYFYKLGKSREAINISLKSAKEIAVYLNVSIDELYDLLKE